MTQGPDTPMLTIPATSPAYDFVPIGTASCTGSILDQRDVTRPQGLGCDAGAFEFDQPPVTSIDSGPSGPTNNNSPSIAFSSTEPGVTFQCSLDGAAFGSTCTSPQSYTGLADGAHTFKVRATDATGNVEAAPPSLAFTVDTITPSITITGGPSGPTNSASPQWTFTSNDPTATLQCALDIARPTNCTSPKAYTGVSDGAHTFTVYAFDGNRRRGVLLDRLVLLIGEAPLRAGEPSFLALQHVTAANGAKYH